MQNLFAVGDTVCITEAYVVGKFPTAQFGGVRKITGQVVDVEKHALQVDVWKVEHPLTFLPDVNVCPGHYIRRTIHNVFRKIELVR